MVYNINQVMSSAKAKRMGKRDFDLGLVTLPIAKGVRLHYLATDKFKTNLLTVSFIAPLARETAAANALIPNILMRGSEKYPSIAEINKRLDYLYAAELATRNSKRGGLQLFGLAADMLDSSYAPDGEDITAGVTELVLELLTRPITNGEAFDPVFTEGEKTNLIDAINADINNKAVYADHRCLEEMCAGERSGILETGSVDDVRSCTPESVYAQYRYALEHYPIELVFVGKCDVDRLAERFAELLSGLARDPIALPEDEVVRKASSTRSVSEDMPVSQGKLVLGLRTGITLRDREFDAMLMFNAIFGGCVTSKLFTNVRERMSLCYYCQSVPDSVSGLMLVRSGIEVESREVAERAILDQLEAVRRGDFTDEELESARSCTVGSYEELSDSAHALASFYLGRLLSGIGGGPSDEVERLRAVTRDEIISAARSASLDTVYFLNGTLKGEPEDE